MSTGTGLIKSVTTDSVIISKAGQERTIRFEGVSVPRLGNRDKPDEEGAFVAREYVRRTIGKEVKFTISNVSTATGNVEYGSIEFEGKNLAIEMLKMGLCSVKETREPIAELLEAATGVDKPIPAVIEVNYSMPVEPIAFFNEYKGKEVEAIVEAVINGSTLRVRLILTPTVHQVVQLAIAGIRAPRSGEGGEPFGDESKEFLEARMLQRSIKVVLLSLPNTTQKVAFGSDEPLPPPNLYIGAVIRADGRNISAFSLASGLSKVIDYHVGFLAQYSAQEMKDLRSAELSAKNGRIGLWKDLVRPIASTSASNATGTPLSTKAFSAIVTRVWGADALSIQEANKPERRITLSSVRQPKTDSNLVGYQLEGKELLRKKLIGKSVSVSIDYIKAADGGYESKECVTIKVAGGLNVATILVEKGLLSVVRHRSEEERSVDYDDLMVAEAKAISESKGIHSGKPSAGKKIIDASESAAKANSFLSSFKRAGKLSAVVDFVSAGSRFKVLLPKESIKLTLVLEGIRTARTNEAFGAAAQTAASLKVLQRDVELTIGGADKSGGFIGSMTIGGTDLAVFLVEQGLAKVDDYSNSKELYAAQETAQASKLGMWKSFDVEAEAEANRSLFDLIPAKKEFIDIVISDIRGNKEEIPFSFAVQVLKNGKSIPELEKLMEELNSTKHEAPGFVPKSNDLVIAQFSQDNQWYRARVRRSNPARKEAEVLYLDYGNSEVVPYSRLAGILPPALARLEPQAKESTLAYVNLLSFFTEHGPASLDLFKDFCEGRQLVANVDRREANLLHLTLFDPAIGSTTSINELMVKEGLGRIDNKTRLSNEEMKKKLIIATEEAKRSRAGAYELGDIFDD